MTEKVKSVLPWVLGMALNVGLLVIGFSTSYAKQGAQGEETRKSVAELKGSIDGQDQKLTKISESIGELKTSAALATSSLGVQDGKIRDLESRIYTMEQRLQQQGERLARKGI